jgi:hypothetical protein
MDIIPIVSKLKQLKKQLDYNLNHWSSILSQQTVNHTRIFDKQDITSASLLKLLEE